MNEVAALDDGSVVLAGFTEGPWDGINQGDKDFAMVELSSIGEEEWRWQVIEDGWCWRGGWQHNAQEKLFNPRPHCRAR